jgi:hypothetical protein
MASTSNQPQNGSNVFGFAVSGVDSYLSLIASGQAGPIAWTGGAFGPEGGLIGIFVALFGMLRMYGWVWCTRKRASVQSEIAQYSPLDRKT